MKLAAEKDIAAKIAAAKAKLVVVETKPNPVAALGAAAVAATAAVLMAGVVSVGPGVHVDEPPMTVSQQNAEIADRMTTARLRRARAEVAPQP